MITQPTAGAEAPDNPALGWAATSGATKYEVQVSPNQAFTGTMSFSQTTANTRATPPNDLAVGTYWWRVRAFDRANVAGPYSTSTFTKTVRDAPAMSYPGDGAALVYPDDALYYEWLPMPGAKGYEIQIDDDALFVGAPSPIATATTSYAPTSPPVFGTTFWWRVRAKSNASVYSQWSAPQSYSMSWDPAAPVTLRSPETSNSPTVEEVVLDWDALPGAAYYQISISPDENFNNPIVNARRVNATRFAPNPNLPAGAYFWKVRAMSTSATAEPGAWSATWTFTRAWPSLATDVSRPRGVGPAEFAQVALLKPDNGDFTLSQPVLSWTPQRGASNYEVQIGSDVNFSPNTYNVCFTDHTTLTPFARRLPSSTTTCNPTYIHPGGVTYWRVRAVDAPSSPRNLGVFKEVRSFLYDPANITQVAPANGAQVEVPVLSWSKVENISHYKVTLQSDHASCTSQYTDTTYNTTFVPENLNPACTGTWHWTVQGIEDDGALTRLESFGQWSTFDYSPPTATASAPTLLASTPLAAYRPPLMRWQPVANATKYVVYASIAGANSFLPLLQSTNQPAFAYRGEDSSMAKLLSPGDYQYYVKAFNGSTVLADSGFGTFHIDPMPLTTLTGPTDCPPSSCDSVEYDTPTFTWEPVDGAGHYIVYLATDPNFTNITREYNTVFTSLTPAESLPDSQAGQATYWFVRPCYNSTNCGQFDPSVFNEGRAFRKQSRAVEALTPAATDVVNEGEVTFTWKDYLKTNRPGTNNVDLEAAYYRVQVSTTQNFTNIIDTSPSVDQTEYTAETKTYPDGPLYWRVQAVDNTGNPLTYSEPIEFEKKLAPPTGLTPGGTAAAPVAVDSTPLLTWDPMAYSGQYELEIYKNPSDALSPVNRVFTVKTRSTSAISTASLPKGDYGWRVRRIDPNNLSGSWSAELNTELAAFRVTGDKPTLIQPPAGGSITGSTLLFTWSPVAGATRYRLEASTSSAFASLIESATTDMTSWAPTTLSPVWPNGTIYWRVHALDSSGAILATSDQRSLVRDVSTAGEFTAVTPYRVLDTRSTKSPLGENQARTVSVVGGASGVPTSGVSAVVLNATAVNPTKSSYLTLYPAGVARPNVSALNWAPKQIVANHVTVPVDWAGRISMYNRAGTVDVLFDVVGYYSNGQLGRGTRFTPSASPTRIADTRGGSGQPHQPLYSSEARRFDVAGLGGVPADATAVVMNVTAVAPTASGYLTVYPSGKARPTSSSLNFPRLSTVPNLVTMPLGTDGDVIVFNSAGNTDVIVDVMGWYRAGDPAPGARMNTTGPARIADTRWAPFAPALPADGTRAFQVRGMGGVPNTAQATGVVLNVTVLDPKASGWVTVFPSGVSRPTASNLNYVKGQTVANQVIAKIGPDGKINVYTRASTQVIIDVVGWLG